MIIMNDNMIIIINKIWQKYASNIGASKFCCKFIVILFVMNKKYFRNTAVLFINFAILLNSITVIIL